MYRLGAVTVTWVTFNGSSGCKTPPIALAGYRVFENPTFILPLGSRPLGPDRSKRSADGEGLQKIRASFDV